MKTIEELQQAIAAAESEFIAAARNPDESDEAIAEFETIKAKLANLRRELDAVRASALTPDRKAAIELARKEQEEANARQLAALASLAEKDKKSSGIRKTTAEYDAEFDAQNPA